MTYSPLTKQQQEWKEGVAAVAERELAPRFPSGGRRLDSSINQRRIAEIGTEIEAARALLLSASSAFERYFRDARAGLVMGMANDSAYQNMIPLMFPES